MKDFNSYVNQNASRGNEASGRGEGNSSTTADAASLLKMLAGKYEGASEDEIISAIVKEAERGKRNGTLTNAEIDAFARTVEPMLNAQQRKRLQKVVAFLKKI